MKLLFGTLLGFFVTSCTVKDSSSDTNINSTESLKKSAHQDLSSYTDINSTESLKKSAQKNFEITPIDYYFYVTNNENEKQIIAFSDNLFSNVNQVYKFDQSGNLIDTLELPARGQLEMYNNNIQPENYFIYLEDGYIPNWIKTGDKTKHQYHKVYNEDLTMDLDPDVMKQYNKMRDDVNEQYRKDVFDDDEYEKRIKQCYDYLDKRAENVELIKLLITLNQQAKYKIEVEFLESYSEISYRFSYIFMINNEVIKVRIPNELHDYIHYKFDNITEREILETVIPDEFPEAQKSFHFVENGHNIIETAGGVYRAGTAYYDLPIGESTLKIKVNSSLRADRIRINRNVFPGNKKFVLIGASNKYYFIKEK